MAGRLSSSAIFRSALAAHASLSAASLISSAVGPSHLAQLPDSSSQPRQRHPPPSSSSTSNSNGHPRDIASMCSALPWLDQLNSVIANMYISGGIKKCGCSSGSLQQHQYQHNNVTMVQIGEDVSFENPIVSYAGAGEVERAFRGRFHLHPQNDVKTVLECVDVEASDDSIVCGSTCAGADQSQSQQHLHPPTPLFGISPSPSPPTVKVTYRLSQQYGTYFSVHSLLLVTIHLRRGCSSEVRKITHEQMAKVPLATSGFTPRAANTVAVSATAYSGLTAEALAKAADKLIMATTRGLETKSQVPSSGVSNNPSQATSPVVAEVVRIEELWNEVQLLQFAPVHWSRRLNGMVASNAAYFFLYL
ncbi:hypothetical protein ACHAXH_009019 [Discostella pseudostelligera]